MSHKDIQLNLDFSWIKDSDQRYKNKKYVQNNWTEAKLAISNEGILIFFVNLRTIVRTSVLMNEIKTTLLNFIDL